MPEEAPKAESAAGRSSPSSASGTEPASLTGDDIVDNNSIPKGTLMGIVLVRAPSRSQQPPYLFSRLIASGVLNAFANCCVAQIGGTRRANS